MMAKSQTATALLALAAATLPATVAAQAGNYPITPTQRAVATQVAQAGVPLSELAPNAPDNYTVKSGDTLWAISRLFLKSPWRWPELWGMNMTQIRNPHLIYPGQLLLLEKKDGRATLRVAGGEAPGEPPAVKLSPRTRYSSLADSALPTLKTNLIEPFLAEPIVVDEVGLRMAPRIVATQEERVLLTRGDRAYARGPAENPLADAPGKPYDFRVFRDATPLKDPSSGEILGYEAQYVGKAQLVRGESVQSSVDKDSNEGKDIVPATIDIVVSKEEMRVGDRLLPEPPRQLRSYTPHAPAGPMEGRIVSVYGSAVVNAAQNQVVVINRGTRDGVDAGMVLAVLKDGPRVLDTTNGERTPIKLPNERNGLMMVFRTYEKVSYALILDITDGVKVGDRLANPR
jgi:nucleoid-associated protein YgaU